MIEEFDQDALAALCPEFRAILDAELAAGNTIAAASRGVGKPSAVHVSLRRPFLTRQPSLPPGVSYPETNDPHRWKGE
jgi:hypothetical protein